MDRLRGNGNEQQLLTAIKQVAQDNSQTEFTEAHIFAEAGITDAPAFQKLVAKALVRPVDGKDGVYRISMKGLR